MLNACTLHARGLMPTLQVRDLPQEIYEKLHYLAEKEHRSLSQETIVLLKEGIDRRLQNQTNRREMLHAFKGLGIDTTHLPTAADLIREDRDNR